MTGGTTGKIILEPSNVCATPPIKPAKVPERLCRLVANEIRKAASFYFLAPGGRVIDTVLRIQK